MATKFIVNILFFSINILIANLAISGTIYAINSDNDALEQFDTGNGNSTTLESLSFYSQGQTVFDPEANKAYIFDGNNDRVIEYNFTTNSSANIAVSSNGDQIQSLIGFDANGDLIVMTDDYGDDKSTAKRFGKLTLTGTLTRIGAPLVSGSAYPQGNQLYDSINNKIYTISNDSSKVFSILDLNTNTASSFSTAGSTLVAFSADNNIAYSVVTGTVGPKVLSLNLSSGTETTLTSTLPTGYDNFASSGYVDIANEELAIFVGGSGVSGVAIYSTVDGSFKRVISTSGTGRFVSMGTIKSVESGVEEFSEDITSTVGDFIKIGAGELNVTGDSSSAGGTYVEEGKLRINGSFESSSVEISTDATLGGAGTVASLVNDGTVAPGNSIGTLNVSGSVVLNSGSILVIEVDANGNSDKIVATGAVTAGGTLRISPESGSYTDGQQYTIITGSSVSGTFANVSVLSCSGTATPTYGSTSITFSLSNCSVSRPTNVSTIISYINDLDTSSSADLQSVVTALNNLTGTEYEAAVATLDANSQTNVRASSVQQISTINSLINQRASGGLDNVTNIASLFNGADTQSNLAITTRGDEHALARSNEPWIKTFIANSKQKDDTEAGINGYDSQAGGFVIGYDVRKNKNLQGLAFSYIDGKTTSNNSEGSSDQKTMVLSGYRVNELGNGSMLSTSLSLVLNDITSSRKIAFTGINRTASASYDALGFDVSTSYTSAPKQRYGGDASTEISFGVFSSQNDAYTETGAGAANLTVDSFASTMGRVGVKEKIVWKDGFDWLSDAIPYASFGINVSSELTAGTASQALSGQSKFVSKTDNGANTDIELGVGFNKKFQNNGVLSSGVTARVGSGFNSQEANLTYRWQF